MDYRYSDYSIEQLRDELSKAKESLMKAEQLGEISKVAIIERKMQMLMSYMLNPSDYHAEDVHELNGDPGHTFKINYINGVMAWGHRINLLNEQYADEEALPISLLGDKVND